MEAEDRVEKQAVFTCFRHAKVPENVEALNKTQVLLLKIGDLLDNNPFCYAEKFCEGKQLQIAHFQMMFLKYKVAFVWKP